MFGTTATWFFALSLLPLAEVSTLSSTTPFIVVALAGPFLGERVTRPALVGTVVGFVGVVVMVGMDPAQLDLAMLVPLANAAIFAMFGLLTRSLRADPPEVTLFYSGLVPMLAAIVLFAVVPTSTAPTPTQWLAIGVVGLVTLTGHRLMVAAYRWGRASDLAPLGYLSLLWAFVVGAIVFAEPIQLRALAGAAAIALGGAVVLRSAPPGEEPAQALGDYGGPVEAEAEEGRP
jgi:drug/metabolite transporter (DMT)-like permease